MKRIFITTLLLLIFNYPCFADDDGAFRGMKWGDPLTKKGFTTLQKKRSLNEDYKLYIKNSEDLEIGSGKASSIIYHFWKNKLYSVTILFEGYANFMGILEASKEKYGNPSDIPGKLPDQYLWLELQMTFVAISYFKDKNSGFLSMTSIKLMEQKDDWEKKKAKEKSKRGSELPYNFIIREERMANFGNN